MRALLLLVIFSIGSRAQTTSDLVQTEAEQTARIIGIDQLLAALHAEAQPTDIQQLMLHQQILERIQAASLDVDSVLAEISNEHARIMELRSTLQGRRDAAENLVNIANLITGTGVGILVNALQFKNSTAILGDAIGVGSGAAATVLGVAGMHIQNGPQHAVVRSPNMLAVPYNRPPVLNSDYPEMVLTYLKSIPPGEPASSGTRLQQLQQEWEKTGRLKSLQSPAGQKKLARLTSSMDTSRRLSISDLTNRAYMLEDVAGRVALMKRDLATLLRSSLTVR